jgi:hypothetical protein
MVGELGRGEQVLVVSDHGVDEQFSKALQFATFRPSIYDTGYSIKSQRSFLANFKAIGLNRLVDELLSFPSYTHVFR